MMANFLQKAADRFFGQKQSNLYRTLMGGSAFGDDVWDNKQHDYGLYQKSFRQISWIYSCASLIATNVAMVKRYLLDAKNNEITSGPVIDLLNNPNPNETWFDYIEGTTLDLLITGNSFWLRDELNYKNPPTPKYLYRLDPKRVSVVVDKQGMVSGYAYDVNGRKVPLEKQDVAHLKTANPLSQYYGMGEVEAAILTAETDLYAKNVNRDFFRHGARLSGMLTAEGVISDDVYRRIKEQFRDEYGGARNAYKIALLEGGLKYEPMSLSPKDMDFERLRKFNRDEILSIFRVPGPKIGIMEYANYKMEEADRTFKQECLTPRLVKLQNFITKEIVRAFNPQYRFEFDAVLVDDSPLEKMIKANTATNGVAFSANDFREYLGWDKVSYGEVPYVSFGIGPADEDGPDMEPIDDSEKAVKVEIPLEAKQINANIKRVARVTVSRINSGRDKIANRFKKAMKEFFNKEEERVIAKLLKVKDPNLIEINKVWNDKKEDAEIAKTALPYLKDSVDFGSAVADQISAGGLKKSVKGLSSEVLDNLAWELARKVKRVHVTTKEKIAAAIAEGIEADLPINEIAYGTTDGKYKGVQGVFDEASDYRAELIARTETLNAYSEAAVGSYKEVGFEKKQWLTAGDAEVRETHQANEAAGPIAMDDVFPGTGESWPGEFNCRCMVLPFAERSF